MNQGLASLPIRRFETGGLANSPIGALFSPITTIDTPFGPISPTPANVISAISPPVVSVPLSMLSLMNTLTATQDPAPVDVSNEAAIAATVLSENVDATDAAEGLAAMNAVNAQAAEAEAAQTDAAMTAMDAVDSVDAAIGAAAAAAATGTDGTGGGGGGGGSGSGGAGAGAGAGTGADGGPSGDGSGGEKAGGIIKRKHYQFGGNVMGMGDSSPRYSYAPIMMAGGGLSSAAQQLQNRGRGSDSMLVHMTPGEVRGLQALAMAHGGSLTINPSTGLPEAGFLSALLPMVAGAFLGPAGIGLASTALEAGLMVGGLTGAATGSLKKGLLAGLGAYGGAGLGEGLVSAATPTTSTVTAAPTSAFDLARSNIDVADLNSLGNTKEAVLQKAFESPAYQQALSNPQLAGSLDTMNAADVAQAKVLPGQTVTSVTPPTGFDAIKSGFENVFKSGTEGKEARAAFGQALPFGTTMAVAAPLASAAAEPPKGPTPSPAFMRPYTFAWNPQTGSYTPSPRPGDTSERRYFDSTFTPQPIYRAAEGGQIDPDYNMETGGVAAFSDGYSGGGATGIGDLAKKRKSLMGDRLYKFGQDRRDQSMEAAIEQNFAKGGLGAVLPPRFLSGGGDGMSDSIKANIDGKQEARLADGEFVVPADVVSHLGNGSSKAGAKKLYAMMDKIRKARTGKTRQAPEVNAAKYMPA